MASSERLSWARFAAGWESSFNDSGGSPDQVSLLHVLFERQANPPGEEPDTDLFDGAAGQIPPLLAAELGDDVVLGARVVALEQDSAGVTAATLGGRYRGHAVIVAIPRPSPGPSAMRRPCPRRAWNWSSGCRWAP